MRRLGPYLLVLGLGMAVAAVVVNRQLGDRHARELEAQRAAWEIERAELEAQLANARAERPAVTPAPKADRLIVNEAVPDARELLKRLAELRVVPGTGQNRALRRALALLDQLAETGPAALPAIREFLATGRDVAFDTSGGKRARDVKALADALIPPTLRFGLFDVLRQIGGDEARAILAESLSRTTSGIELAYLSQILEGMSPGAYRAAALAAAHALLISATGSDRDNLFGVLQQLGDTSYVTTAQAQLIQPDGKVDRSALRYLQQTLGEQSVALAAQTYRDPRVTEADSKEPLARVALAYVGANDQALELYHTAILDPALQPDQRRELVEDLNTDGLSNKKNPSAADLEIIAKRYMLTQAYLQQDYVQSDKVLLAAFREADKDLRAMLQKAAAATANPAQPGQ